jgi:cytidylate kinase
MLSMATDRFVEALARLHQVEKSQGQTPQQPPITIAISRQAGARGAEIARLTGERLGWPAYDHELLQRIAEEKGLQKRLLERLDERHLSWMEMVAADLFLGGGSKEVEYLRSLLRLFAALSEQGHCVIVGRGAPHALPAETTLRVRVMGPRSERVESIQKRLGLSRADAERWIDRTDAERGHFVKHYFHRDTEDAAGYDLILNTSKLTVGTCADVIAAAARALEASPKGQG